MFDVKNFAIILQKIVSTYSSISEFAEKSEVNRTYLSKYINMKLDNPPTPKILEKIANNSNDIISYVQLMEICGYYEDNYSLANGIEKEVIDEYEHTLNSYNFTDIQKKELFNILSSFLTSDSDSLKKHMFEFSSQFINNEKNIYNLILEIFTSVEIKYEKQLKIFGNALGISNEETDAKIKQALKEIENKQNQYYMCPVYRSNFSRAT